MLLFKNWFFGIIFVAFACFGFKKSKKDIDRVDRELKEQAKKAQSEKENSSKE